MIKFFIKEMITCKKIINLNIIIKIFFYLINNNN